MCVIIWSKDTVVSNDILKRSATVNPHGLGITNLETYETTFFESKDWELLSGMTNYLAHFRYATIGEVNTANTHPFQIPGTDCMLYQNGSVYTLGNDSITDAQEMASILGDIKRRSWRRILQLTDCRWAVVDSKMKTLAIYNKDEWHEDNGSMFSKANVLSDDVIENHTVAVYGTLKQGGGNDHRLTDSTYIGSGQTDNKYPMMIDGIPFVIDRPGDGHHVVVEVYQVSDKVLASLDSLEGHPDWYERRETKILLDSGLYETAMLYFNDSATDTGIYAAEYPIIESSFNTWGNTWGDYEDDSSYTTGWEASKHDKAPCDKCNSRDTLWDDFANRLWCTTCDGYTTSPGIDSVNNFIG